MSAAALRYEAQSAPPRRSSATQQRFDDAVPEAQARLLLVDDDAIMRRSIARLLSKAGYAVTTANDGREALEILQRQAFHAIVSDIHMPNMSGVELLEVINRSGNPTPMILLTGEADVPSAVAAVEHKAIRYLTKPVSAELLWAAVRDAVAHGEETMLRRRAADAVREQAEEERRRALALTDAFDEAIANLWIAFQPIMCGERVYGFETLMRSHGPRMRFPLEILDAAENLGRIHDLGRAVRARIAESFAALRGEEVIFVNIHPNDLLDDQLYSPNAPLSQVANRIVLEITERASLAKTKDLSERIAQLRALGYRIAVDDLGAGYAGLMAIAQLEPEVVKLDMSLVRDCHLQTTKRSLVGGMLAIAKQLGTLVIAEGVERCEERDTLAQLGCSFMQGYFFAKPLPLAETLAALRAR